MTTLLLPTDGCPFCITPDPVHPHTVEPMNDYGDVVAWYACPSCGYFWWTSWSASAKALPCPGCPACTNEKRGVA